MIVAKTTHYVCTSCDAEYPKWLGKCSKCGEFGTVEEHALPSGGGGNAVGVKGDMRAAVVTRRSRPIATVDTHGHAHSPTGIGELDRVLGGGFVAGQVILLAGEPGVGKSTILLSVAHNYAAAGRTVLYVSGEESAEQISLRARRINADAPGLLVADETDLSVVLGHIEQDAPDLVIVDSIQTISSPDVDGRAGGVAQIQEVATVLTRIAKSRKCVLVLVGQITKNNDIGGPKLLEHLVDTVIMAEGERNTGLRLLRGKKNRFGSVDEIGAFEQTEAGMIEVPDPSGLFATERQTPTSGICVTVTMEGRRPLLAELQALVAPTNAPNPRRGVSGLESARSAMLVAVTERYGRLRLFDKDTFLATVAGMKLTEPAADLATCLALASAGRDEALPLDVIAIGEVALSGDIRRVPDMRQRLNEASRLGYRRALVPPGSPTVTGITNINVTHLTDALQALTQMNSARTNNGSEI